MSDHTNLIARFGDLLCDLPGFAKKDDDVTPAKFATAKLNLSGNVRDIESAARSLILDNVEGLGDVRVVLDVRYWKGDIVGATTFNHGGRVKIVQNGWRPGKGNTACPDVTIVGAKVTDAEAFALDIFEAIVVLRGLTTGTKVTDKDGKSRAAEHWQAISAEFGVEYIALDKGDRDDFQRQFGTFGDCSGLVERFNLTDSPTTVRAFLPKGGTWRSEVKRILGNRKANKASAQWAVSCVCDKCAAEAHGDTDKERIQNATRKIAVDLLRKDPMSGACRHGVTFRVVEGKNGLRAEATDLRDAMEKWNADRAASAA